MKRIITVCAVCVAMLLMGTAGPKETAAETAARELGNLVMSVAPQAGTVTIFEYTPVGGKIQVDIHIGTKDASGAFTETGLVRYTYVADAASTANLTKIGDTVKNRLTTLAASL